jgi:hypothetical protein
VLSRAPATPQTPAAPPSSAPRTLSREATATPAPLTVARQATSTPSAGIAHGGGGSGGDSAADHQDLLRHLREEREQLGQLIPHPF